MTKRTGNAIVTQTALVVAVFLFVGAAVSTASADMLYYDGMGKKAAVRIEADGMLADGKTVHAGQLRLRYQDESYLGWCVDLDHYTGTDEVEEWSYSTLNNADEVAYLFETYADDVVSGRDAAGLQAAIWEVINETSGTFDVTDGYFQIRNNGAAVQEANGLLATLPGSYTPQTELLVLHSDTKQDVLIGTGRPNPVPEPATVVLLLAGGAFAVHRRRKLA